MKKPQLTLVGAGPGDPDLISMKGVKALAEADVILYDALVHPSLLDYAPADALRIFVGKKVGFCEFAQHDIHDLIIQYAFSHGHVVRLKGGDPFVFGRGYEELSHARRFGIATEVIPGISSSIAVPEMQSIPLTCRGINESFWVVTGTTMNHELSRDISLAAQSTATIVILMGMKNLKKIVEIFKAAGKADTPAAIIQNGTLADEKLALGMVENLVEVSEAQQLRNPAVIVIGEVVSLHPNFVRAEVQKYLM
ncbi:MAG: uroporphyrinogen-III C-methyltransferase [Bacteroidota bacterium]